MTKLRDLIMTNCTKIYVKVKIGQWTTGGDLLFTFVNNNIEVIKTQCEIL